MPKAPINDYTFPIHYVFEKRWTTYGSFEVNEYRVTQNTSYLASVFIDDFMVDGHNTNDVMMTLKWAFKANNKNAFTLLTFTHPDKNGKRKS